MPNPNTSALSAAGVSVWLDDLSRTSLADGTLARLIADTNVVGVTTNPAIFAAAIGKDDSYSDSIASAAAQGLTANETVLQTACADVAAACDLLLPVYNATQGRDGRVSIEVEPQHAHDRDATVAQAKELWRNINRENLMIKVPATPAGMLAVADLIASGISVNVTLIFSVTQYREVINAYLVGIERALDAGLDISKIHSVASVFISRLDTATADTLAAADAAGAELYGKLGVANARLIYEVFQQVSASERWQLLASQGAQPQRPLWASTGVKDPALPATLYVDELIAADTVTTLPRATLAAFAESGTVQSDTITPNIDGAHRVLNAAAQLGVDYTAVTAELARDGLEKFEIAWNELIATVAGKMS
ncbi:transaldolase [Canibacter zhoujuaniae]|uniref:transaldolase n=1 Tax=Canibacter zhoujuaniae TaxID=2708343 RepID=UPI001420719C|nr:transaldolase [Canibacter zhoujuaniae]